MACQDLSWTVTDLLPTAGPFENLPIQGSFVFQRAANVNSGRTGQSSVSAFLIIAFFLLLLRLLLLLLPDGTKHRIVPLSLLLLPDKIIPLSDAAIFLTISDLFAIENDYKL